MDIPVLLSGNFGELRSNHFHSGIDFKTQGVEGKPIHSVQDGYVSRISVSPWGYGNGLYITHPDGTTTVYGHLQKFSQKITAYLKEKQYEQESFNVNLSLTPDELPVKEGERARKAEANEGIDWKALSHACRGGLQLLEIYKTGDLVYPLQDAPFILDVKLGKHPFKTVQEFLEDVVDQVEVASTEASKNGMQQKVDMGFWDDFLERVYLENHRSYYK